MEITKSNNVVVIGKACTIETAQLAATSFSIHRAVEEKIYCGATFLNSLEFLVVEEIIGILQILNAVGSKLSKVKIWSLQGSITDCTTKQEGLSVQLTGLHRRKLARHPRDSWQVESPLLKS